MALFRLHHAKNCNFLQASCTCSHKASPKEQNTLDFQQSNTLAQGYVGSISAALSSPVYVAPFLNSGSGWWLSLRAIKHDFLSTLDFGLHQIFPYWHSCGVTTLIKAAQQNLPAVTGPDKGWHLIHLWRRHLWPKVKPRNLDSCATQAKMS